MAFRHALSLYLILAFMWSEEALSFSSPTSRGITALPSSTASSSTKHSSGMRTMQLFLPSLEIQRDVLAKTLPRPLIQSTQLTMSSDDSSGEKEATKEKGEDDEGTKTQKNRAILVVPLFCKFAVVLMIKFLTDLIVFPTLFVWRLARKTKRMIVGWFDKISFGTSAKSFKPNGSGK